MKLHSKIVWGGAVIALVAIAVWALRPQPVSVEIETISEGMFEQTIDEDGKTRVRERYIVAAPLAGQLERIAYKVGDAVRAGEVVANIVPNLPLLQDTRTVLELRERLAAADASLMRATAMESRAQSALAQARVDAARSAKLAREGFVASANREQAELAASLREKELEAARYDRVAAERERAQAEAALSRVRQDGRSGSAGDGKFEVRAPVSGRVLRVMQESAGPVAVGTALLEIADVRRLEAVIDVLSTEAVNIPENADVHIDAGAMGGAMSGRVRRVEPSAFTKVSALGVEEQRVNVIVDLLDGDRAQALGDAYRVDARIVVFRAHGVALVPTGATYRDGVGYAVYVVENGVARKRSIDMARRNTRVGMVTRGLDAGERVIAFPSDAVADGVRIEVRNRSQD